MNQIERFFAEITAKRIRRGAFRSVQAPEQAVMDYLDHPNKDPSHLYGRRRPKPSRSVSLEFVNELLIQDARNLTASCLAPRVVHGVDTVRNRVPHVQDPQHTTNGCGELIRGGSVPKGFLGGA
jgi:hypothetical protein